MLATRFLPLALAFAIAAHAQQAISFAADDGGQVCGLLYGRGAGEL